MTKPAPLCMRITMADQSWLVAASYAVALAAEVVKHPGGAPSLSPEVLRDIHW